MCERRMDEKRLKVGRRRSAGEAETHSLDDIPSAHTLSHPISENELITSVGMKDSMIDVANMQTPSPAVEIPFHVNGCWGPHG